MARNRAETESHSERCVAVMTISIANINSLWGSLIIEELIRHGIECFCVSPGSRSAPLTAAAARNPRARPMVHFDERGAAFYALGYARAANRPAALICTSGTAAANYLPAIIESSADTVPLIVLTADRPPELRDTGANQAIKQPGIFGDNVRWSFDLPCPDTAIAPEMVLTAIDQAVYRACRAPSGPVHLNCMFREPLAPVDTGDNFDSYLANLQSWRGSRHPYTRYEIAGERPGDACVTELARLLRRSGRGLLVAGNLRTEKDRHAVLALAARLKWPMFADITSGLRLGDASDFGIPFYNLALASEQIRKRLRPSMVLHIGGRMTAKRLLQWLQESRPESYIHVEDNPVRLDPIHRVTGKIESDIALLCARLAGLLDDSMAGESGEYLLDWRQVSETVDRVIRRVSARTMFATEAGIARLLSAGIDGSAL
ncbi:MAG TPA: 2-succinyl-5-enolpyruvyl-6-hydroxy-3-cyclohexene-1-carboxylic-acid synthase, partial [Acidobacteriota bacterium]|nr:2-succinyl-5-enolpyruvyl-6-hydroxy-3-cyclohexene-1-carboxylic-acid synthase [Acidobacteriota bacterium]